MNGNETDRSKSFLSPLSWLILVGIVSRLFLLNWYRGEYTDGIIQLGLFENQNTFFPPLYPFLCHLTAKISGDLVVAGRLVSLVASTLVLIPLYHLARRLFSDRTAIWTGVLYLISAVPNRWALRVMSDSLFTLFFTVSVLAFIMSMQKPLARAIPELSAKKSKEFMLHISRTSVRRWLYLLIFFSGLAILTRYQGLALVPLIAVSLYYNYKGYSRWELIETTIALLPWPVLFYWLMTRGFGHAGQFIDRVADL